MKPIKSYWQIMLVGLLVLGNCFNWYFVARESRGDLLTISYLDVGSTAASAAAVYIEGPNGVQILIDTGNGKQVLTALGRVMPFYDRSIDVVLTTSAGQTHSGGLAYVLDRYNTLLTLAPITQADIGKSIELGSGATLTLAQLTPFTAELKYGATNLKITNEYPFEVDNKFYNPNLTGTVTLKIPKTEEPAQISDKQVEKDQTANVIVSVDTSESDNLGNEKVQALLQKIASTTLPSRTKTSGCLITGPYPDRACSPGAIFPDASLEKICVSGYTKKVRNVSVSTKKKVYAEYGVSYPQKTGTYEADHIIPLELGGSNDIANLFPEAQDPRPGFREKDLVENYLHLEVCAGRIDLGAAQKQIASDWLAVYNLLSPSEIKSLRSYWGN